MMLEDHRALGFGGVRGEHQFEMHPRQRRRDPIGIDAAFQDLLETLSPQRLHGGEAVLGLRQALSLHGRVLLDHAEQMKRDRVRLRQALGRERAPGRRSGLAPGEMRDQRKLSGFLEDLAKAAHHEREVPLHLRGVEGLNRRQDHRVTGSFQEFVRAMPERTPSRASRARSAKSPGFPPAKPA